MNFGGNSRGLKFNQKGLVPAIVQDAETNQVLTYVYMNKEAVKRTKKGGDLWLYHRKMKKVWKKGAKSGRTKKVSDMMLHHDRNVILVKAIQNGPACNTGNITCFMNSFMNEIPVSSDNRSDEVPEDDGLNTLRKMFESQDLLSEVEIVPAQKEQAQKGLSEDLSLNFDYEANADPDSQKSHDFMDDYFSNIQQKISDRQNNSYSADVAKLGSNKIAQKIGENAMQLMVSATQNDNDGIVNKEAEMVHHLLILLAKNRIEIKKLKSELVKRTI